MESTSHSPELTKFYCRNKSIFLSLSQNISDYNLKRQTADTFESTFSNCLKNSAARIKKKPSR